MTQYDPSSTMREARAKYFEDNNFGPNGGYDDKWVDFKLGTVPFPFPNTPSRVRAVRYHDLHHVLTGYKTDFLGELEISAWELGAGCKDFYAAWQLNLSGAFAGAFLQPERNFRAFVRGRRSESLYGLPIDEVLDQTVAEARKRVNIPEEPKPKADAKDVGLYGAMLGVGAAVSVVATGLALAMVPVGLAFMTLRKSKLAQQMPAGAARA